jgi:hypothetical protein
MYLARHEIGKAVTVYNVDSFLGFKRVSGEKQQKILREEKAWRFAPTLGKESNHAPSMLCEGGFAALAESEAHAVAMLKAFEAATTQVLN